MAVNLTVTDRKTGKYVRTSLCGAHIFTDKWAPLAKQLNLPHIPDLWLLDVDDQAVLVAIVDELTTLREWCIENEKNDPYCPNMIYTLDITIKLLKNTSIDTHEVCFG